MQKRSLWTVNAAATAAAALLAMRLGARAERSVESQQRVIPVTWNDSAVRTAQLPLANPAFSPEPVLADFYYRMPVRPVYASYPIYAPGREPPGYLDSLRTLQPRVVFDSSTIRTDDDWMRAGRLVFEAPIAFDGEALEVVRVDLVRDSAWYQGAGVPVTKDGIMPFARYVIRKQGVVEVGSLSCAMCHTRVMPDGSLLQGAQGNFPFDRALAVRLRANVKARGNAAAALEEERTVQRALFRSPWLPNDPAMRSDSMSLDEMLAALEAIPPGVNARHGTGLWSPAQIPDLIGVRERRYLDRTGLVRHRDIGDLMRYAALNQDADMLSRYGEQFRPLVEIVGRLPEPTQLSRYSDAQLYALARFLYSLEPPSNPNTADARARDGERIFEREKCGECHTPPLYTNNKLTPARGFRPPAQHLSQFDIMSRTAATDPGLATLTRRGTGYYKVPSLRGLWYRSPLEHNGSVATLEDWFDPRRTEPGYVPSGFKPHDVKTRAVPGHRFGLALSAADRAALIAFLRTL
ncbi:MAG: hypothetical protein ACT4P6_17490 [Gemmatimonadaceae bacterium]